MGMTALTIAAVAACGGCSVWQIIQYYFRIGREWTVWAAIAASWITSIAASAVTGDAFLFVRLFVAGTMCSLITIATIAAATRQRWRDVFSRCLDPDRK